MRDADLIDSYPPWVQYYAPLLNDFLLSQTRSDIQLADTAEFLDIFGPRVAASTHLKPEDVDQLATRANLDAWASLAWQYRDGIGEARAYGHPEPSVNWGPDWFTVPEPREHEPDDEPDYDAAVVESLLRGHQYITLLAKEYGQVVTALAWLLEMYRMLAEPDRERYFLMLDQQQRIRDRGLQLSDQQPHGYTADQVEALNDAIEQLEQRAGRALAVSRFLTALVSEVRPADTALAGLNVHAAIPFEVDFLLVEIARDTDDIKVGLAIDPTVDHRWKLIPRLVKSAMTALETAKKRDVGLNKIPKRG